MRWRTRAISCLVGVGLTACAHGEPAAILALPSDAQRTALLPDLDVQPTRSTAEPLQAVVVLAYDLDSDGRVQRPTVVYATPPSFGERAAQDLASWRFDPVPASRRARKIRLSYRGSPTDLQITAAMPAPGDCDSAGEVAGAGGRRWVLVSCSPSIVKHVAVEGLVGWRSLGRRPRGAF